MEENPIAIMAQAAAHHHLKVVTPLILPLKAHTSNPVKAMTKPPNTAETTLPLNHTTPTNTTNTRRASLDTSTTRAATRPCHPKAAMELQLTALQHTETAALLEPTVLLRQVPLATIQMRLSVRMVSAG